MPANICLELQYLEQMGTWRSFCEFHSIFQCKVTSLFIIVDMTLARLNLTSKSKIKGSLFFKMFIYMYKKDFPQKNIFFSALTGRPEAIYFTL